MKAQARREGTSAAAAKPSRSWTPFVACGILLISFALGLFRLGFQAALGDDAFSLVIAGKTLGELLRLSASEPHPPVFYLLLSGWVRAAGDSEFAGRFLAVWWGLVAAALTYRLGARLLNPASGLLAAFVLVTSPLFVAYQQQSRMYTMVVALGLASMWYAHRLLTGQGEGSRSDRVAYVAATLLAVATHFFAFFLVGAQNLLALGMLLRRRDWGALRVWIGLQALVVAAYLPWVAVAFPTLSSYGNELVTRPSLDQALWRTLRAYILGESAPQALDWLPLLAAALLAVGVAACWRRRQWLPVAYALLPPVLVFLASLVRPMYFERYMLVALPGCALVTAAGIGWLAGRWRWTLAPALAVPVIAAVAVLPGYYAETRYAGASDLRAMVGYAEALALPDAVLVSNLPASDPTYQYYYRGKWPLVYLPEAGDAAAVTTRLAGLTAQHSELWYLPYGAERAIIEPWLDAHAVKVSDAWYADARLVRYAFPAAAPPAPGVPLDLRMEQGIRLAGYSLAATEVEPGQAVLVTLFWQVEAAPSRRFKLFAQLLDGQDRLWGQQDSEPGGGLRPTTSWRPGAQISETLGMVVLPGTPPEELRLVAGLYDAATGARLKTTTVGTADSVSLGTVRVVSPPSALPMAAYGIQKRLEMQVGGGSGLILKGFNVGLAGGGSPSGGYRGGQVIQVTLFWAARAGAEQAPSVSLSLTGPGGEPLAVAAGPVSPEGYPPSRWGEGDVVRDQRYLFLPGQAPAGQASLIVSAGAWSARLTTIDLAGN